MNPEAPFESTLFDSILSDGPPDRVEHDDLAMLSDLNLDQVFAAVAADRDEYDLMPLFSIPLRDVRGVEYRHQVLRDLENKAVSDADAEAFQALDEFCARRIRYIDEKIRRFDREVQFYAAYLAFIAPMRAAGLEFCYPAMSVESRKTVVRDAFDLALAAKLMPRAFAVVRNDFQLGGPERIVFVTHMYDLAGRYYAAHDPAALFLRAERRPDGQRTFRVLPGEPLPTSYGEDLYQQVFGTADTEALV